MTDKNFSLELGGKPFWKYLGVLVVCLVLVYGIYTYKSTNQLRVVSVSGQGIVKVSPDTLILNFSVQEKGKSSAEAQNKINEMTSKFVEEMQKIGVKKTSIQTSNYYVYPNYHREEKTSEQIMDSYQASQNITVTLNGEGFNSLGEQVLNLAPTIGDILINGSNFTVTDKAKGENDARKLAIDAAYQKAIQLANGGKAKVGQMLNISESINAGGYYPVYANAKVSGIDMAMLESADSVSLEAGENEVVVTVNVSYQLK